MTERRANKWARGLLANALLINRFGGRGEIAAADAERIKTKMRAIGMNVD
jgi:hypothetical protein